MWIGAGDLPLVPLVLLADVDEERRVGRLEQLAGARGVDLVDLGAHLLQELAVTRHDFPKYSGAERGLGWRFDDPARACPHDRRGRRGASRWPEPSASRSLQTRGESTTAPGAVTKPRKGRPPLFLDFGVRGDAEARDLSRAPTLSNKGKRAAGRARSSRATTRCRRRSAPRSRAGRAAVSTS